MFIRGHSVHWGAPWGSSDSFRVAGFIRERPGNRRVRSGSLGSLRCAIGVVGFVRGWFVGLCARRVRSVSLEYLGCAVGVVGIVWCRWVH